MRDCRLHHKKLERAAGKNPASDRYADSPRARPTGFFPLESLFLRGSAPENHRPRAGQPAHFHRGWRWRDCLQRRDLQSPRIARRAGKFGPSFPIPLGHGNRAARLPAMGQGLLCKTSRHVRGCAVEQVPEAHCPGARPHGHQAAVHRTPGRRTILRVRAESPVCSPRD